MTHPVLSALPAAMQRSEIQRNRARLEEIQAHRVTSLSYPYDSQSDYTVETVAAVWEVGFTCACSNFADIVWQGTDLLQLLRVLVRDWAGEELARGLEE